MIRGRWTRRNVIRYDNGYRKWYRAIIDQNFHQLRPSRRVFQRADDANMYHHRFMARLRALRGG